MRKESVAREKELQDQLATASSELEDSRRWLAKTHLKMDANVEILAFNFAW